MFKSIAICFFAVFSVVAAKPGIVAPLAYSAYSAAPFAYSAYSAAPLAYSAYSAVPLAYSSRLAYTAGAAVVGSAAYVAPYASSYNTHTVAHTAAFPSEYAVATPAVIGTHFAAPLLLKK